MIGWPQMWQTARDFLSLSQAMRRMYGQRPDLAMGIPVSLLIRLSGVPPSPIVSDCCFLSGAISTHHVDCLPLCEYGGQVMPGATMTPPGCLPWAIRNPSVHSWTRGGRGLFLRARNPVLIGQPSCQRPERRNQRKSQEKSTVHPKTTTIRRIGIPRPSVCSFPPIILPCSYVFPCVLFHSARASAIALPCSLPLTWSSLYPIASAICIHVIGVSPPVR